jgi:hypothetical protein
MADLHLVSREVFMNIRKDVLHLIFLCEKIQVTLLERGTLSPDEANMIRQCARELLDTVPAPAEADASQFVMPF